MDVKDLPRKRVVIGKSVKRVSLQRYLVSKIAYFPEKVVERDIWALFSNQLFLQEKALREQDFGQKFGSSLEDLSKILKSLNLSSGVTQRGVRLMGGRFQEVLVGFLVPKRNYQSWESRMGSTYHLIFAEPEGVKKKDLPTKSRIGVGYRDKGSTRDKAKDGSPPWQEIATRVANLEREIEELHTLETKNGSAIETLQRARLLNSKRKELDRIKGVH